MQPDQMNLIDKMFEYNLWANTQLIKLCSGLDNKQLEAKTAGVFGRIQPTLVHIIRAEGGYLSRLTGARPWAEDLDWDKLSISDLLEKAQLSGTRSKCEEIRMNFLTGPCCCRHSIMALNTARRLKFC